MPRVICVLRGGGEYGPEHVARLRDQVARFCGLPFVALSDEPVPGVTVFPLVHNWPGWWAKMELFRPGLAGGLLFFDLDTSIVGDLGDMAARRRLTIMRDVYRPAGLQSSVMFLPEADREAIWTRWMDDPERWMRTYQRGGDQAFLEDCGAVWSTWQDAIPGQVVSYKVHVRKAMRPGREFGNGSVPAGARVVAFHGKPRPWEVGW
ncbi:hypothetical protein JI664_12670 [Rhodobacter sp. NTK016B]|uniref:hypothetical protein n=1 Tax=Rhodobacter sp. NTK016B TaxID=2759676 RepID=UPI001A901D46|nr:hypothetical protein [Rhodobacter sp. NTK016B]MBN8292820.1 hypothetical protein [Rhodobacter sp. NTK016B]